MTPQKKVKQPITEKHINRLLELSEAWNKNCDGFYEVAIVVQYGQVKLIKITMTEKADG